MEDNRSIAQKKFGVSSILNQVPDASRVLVLAPHPDDEIIGCGGALLRHVKKGAKIKVLYMTDGRHGRLSSVSEEDTIEIRQTEAKAANETLGVRELEFWEYIDDYLEMNDESVDRLLELLNDYKPDLVYVPYFLDEHKDHWSTNYILVECMKKQSFDFSILAYETWTPLMPNFIVNITNEWETKLEALGWYESQQRLFRIVELCDHLNSFRGVRFRLNKFKYCEAFFRSEPNQYATLFDKLFFLNPIDRWKTWN